MPDDIQEPSLPVLLLAIWPFWLAAALADLRISSISQQALGTTELRCRLLLGLALGGYFSEINKNALNMNLGAY